MAGDTRNSLRYIAQEASRRGQQEEPQIQNDSTDRLSVCGWALGSRPRKCEPVLLSGHGCHPAIQAVQVALLLLGCCTSGSVEGLQPAHLCCLQVCRKLIAPQVLASRLGDSLVEALGELITAEKISVELAMKVLAEVCSAAILWRT